MPDKYSPEAVALARLRRAARAASSPSGATEPEARLIAAELRDAANALDNAGVFAAVDLQTDYAQPDEILEAAARDRHPAGQALDPAEWGDTTRDDMARHQGLDDVAQRYGGYGQIPVADPQSIKPLTPLTQEQAEALFEGGVTQGRTREAFRKIQDLDRGSVYGRDPKPGSHPADPNYDPAIRGLDDEDTDGRF